MYINERMRRMARVKWEDDRTGFLRLDMNENPAGLPEEFVRGVCAQIDGGLLARYPDQTRLTAALSEREGVRPEQIALTNGSDEAIRGVLGTFAGPGSRAVIVTPSFEMYRIYSEMLGVELVRVPFGEDLTLPLDVLKSEITPQTDLVILFNPNSPIGEAYTLEELRELLTACRQAGALAVIDEAYYPFGVSSAVKLLEEFPDLIVLRTFSKLYSLAGLRVGYALGNQEWIRCLQNGLATYNVNAVGLLFAEELLKRSDVIEGLLRTEAEGRRYLLEQLEQAGCPYYAGGGNYVLVKPVRPAAEIAAKLYQRGILIKTYQSGVLKDWIRVTTGSKEIMEQFWEAYCSCEDR